MGIGICPNVTRTLSGFDLHMADTESATMRQRARQQLLRPVRHLGDTERHSDSRGIGTRKSLIVGFDWAAHLAACCKSDPVRFVPPARTSSSSFTRGILPSCPYGYDQLASDVAPLQQAMGLARLLQREHLLHCHRQPSLC